MKLRPIRSDPLRRHQERTGLCGVLGFDVEAAAQNVRRIAPQARVIRLSAKSGEGIKEWYDLLGSLVNSGKG